MQDRPTAPELLDAMAADLFGEVREWVPRERRFHILVLANLCAVLAREWRSGGEPSRADLASFEALLDRESSSPRGDDGDVEQAARMAATELAGRIRAGELDDELPAVIDELRSHVARKLDTARPGYADPA